MKDLNESLETKDVQPEVSNPGNVSESAKASIQGIEPAAGSGLEKNKQTDFSQVYVDDKIKYYEELHAHKQNVIEHEEDWKKKGFSVEDELKTTDEEIKNTSRLMYEEVKKKNEKE